MKKLVAMSIATAIALSTAAYADETADLKKEVEKLQKDLKRLKSQVSDIKRNTNGDNVKFSVDLRSSYDKIDYTTKGGANPGNNVLSNRVMLNMVSQPVDNLVFKGSVVANKLYGHDMRTNNTAATFNNFDWFGTTTPDDGILRLREANFIHFGKLGNVGTTFSIGRRPSLDGMPGYLREDNEHPNSPNSHNINMEFDGASLGFNLDQLTGVTGMNFKICAGRGYSNTNGKYDLAEGNPSYAEASTDTPNMDMIGFIWKFYDDAQYKVSFNYATAVNMLGLRDATDPSKGFQDVGDMDTMSLTFEANGLGSDFEGFLANSKAFISFAQSVTHPKDGVATYMNHPTYGAGSYPVGMLGSTDSETGTSFWAGYSWQCLFDETLRLGIEYNQGSEYWRSFTYGEDTLVGSKLAARGSAVEFYANKDLIEKYLTMQVRYTQIDYDYTGSDMFFGVTGMPMEVDSAGNGTVESAENLRVSIRYRY